MEDRLEIGNIVYSKSGRDKGNYFVVVKINELGELAHIADGMTRRLAAPKKKNVKHLKCCGAVSDAIKQKLLTGKKVFDSELKSALKHLTTPKQEKVAAEEK